MNSGELPSPGQDQSGQTQFPTGAPSWLNAEPLARPSFPDVERIPKSPFEIGVRTVGQTGKSLPYYEDLRPHAFYGLKVSGGALIYPGLLITYLESSSGGTAVPEIWQPAGLTTEPLLVSSGVGDIICLKFDINGTTYAVSNVRVEPGTPNFVPAAGGGTCEVEIGTVTSAGFSQKLRSDYFYTSTY